MQTSISARLYGGFLTLLLLALTFLGTISTASFLQQQTLSLNQFLETEARGIADRLESLFAQPGPRETWPKLLAPLIRQRTNKAVPYKTTLLILDDQGHILAQSNQALDLTGDLPRLAPGEVRIEDFRDRGTAFRILTTTYAMAEGRLGVFRLACLLGGVDAPFNNFLLSLLFSLGGGFVVLSILGAGLIRYTLRPVRLMSKAASEISERNLDTRIPLPPGRDDLNELARTLNGLLARLETEFGYQERLVGELTHQLKTPLSLLRGRNELGLTTRHTFVELQELVQDNLSDIDTVVNLLNTLLELARLDARIDKLKTSPIDLARLVEGLEEELQPLLEAKGLHFVREGLPVTVQADAEGLKQVLMNLYDNAWKFSPKGGTITTQWSVQPDLERLSIRVANQGPPIPEGEQELIFQRFFRSAKQPAEPKGNGLGLSIVRSLVALHGGQISAANLPSGGVVFEITLPWQEDQRPPL